MDTPRLHELLLLAPHELVDDVGDALMELGALSVSIEDADADTPDEDALYGEPGMEPPRGAWRRSDLRALFPSDAQAQDALTLLLAQDWARDVHGVAMRAVDEHDWVRLTQSQFPPVEITPQFWVVPSWHEVPPQATKVLRLDPGQAFGTGTHATTRMCLRWLAEAGRQGRLAGAQVLDYGCGSGILAITAALHGAPRPDACDIDAAALQATEANAAANGVTLGRVGSPDEVPGPEALYDVVLANILARPLLLLAPVLAARVRPGGHLVLAGILERQAEDLALAYAKAGLSLRVSDRQEGWVLMTASRPVP